MTPSEFMRQYRQLSVTLDGGEPQNVDVHWYLENKDGKAATALAMYGQVGQAIRALARRRHPFHSGQLVHGTVDGPVAGTRGFQVPADRHAEPDPPQDLHHAAVRTGMVPYGKGSPQAVAEYLRQVVVAEIETAATLQHFASDTISAAHARYIGLDCSGFVANYLIAIGERPNPPANAASFAVGHPKRMTLDSLSYLDIMVWSDGGHVAIMEGPSNGVNGVQCTVVECNGHRGLDGELYQFDSVDHQGIFTVRRQDGSIQHVKVFDWNLA